MVSPRPVPPYFLVVDASSCEKASNIFSFLSGLIPIPVSLTDMRYLISLNCGSVNASTFSSISPFSVNFTALPNKLIRICLRRSSSAQMYFGKSDEMFNNISKPLLCT
ncbi:hypothetical protein D3C78_1532410 [compost metagenome]